MSTVTLEDLAERLAVVADRTERIENILMGNAAANAGVVTRLAGVETKLDERNKTVLRAGGVGAAVASLLSAVTAVLLRHLGV